MKQSLFAFILLCFTQFICAQAKIEYKISFPQAVHHLAEIEIVFPETPDSVLPVRMSRTSPGRYALHEFAKNVFEVKAFDPQGNSLQITRPDPHQWNIQNPIGKTTVKYRLFGDRGDGTYSQIDETHAHLNIPATFMFAPVFSEHPIEITFHPVKELNWKVATQLEQVVGNTFSAPNLQYFMDSPAELSNFTERNFNIRSNGKVYTIYFILHHNGTEEDTDRYFEQVKEVVEQEKQVFGELPDFDFGEYHFLACYLPNVSGDGMEHRNSTVVTDVESLAAGGMKGNIGTVAHEFFHAWNVERIRPKSLEPFDFTEANMSGELWFAEGFTTYYTNLILCRAKILSEEQYVKSLAGTLNYVWKSNGRKFFNPIEMSYQAPFVDAATSVDPVNRDNTFISYYAYGSALGLALDLALRNLDTDKNLDGFMKMVYQNYGKPEINYTLENLQNSLGLYAGTRFSNDFFERFIYRSEMPDYEELLGSVGVSFEQSTREKPFLGAEFIWKNNQMTLVSYPVFGSPVFEAGLTKDDTILTINNKNVLKNYFESSDFQQFEPGNELEIVFKRNGDGKERITTLKLTENKEYKTALFNTDRPDILKRRKDWLGSK